MTEPIPPYPGDSDPTLSPDMKFDPDDYALKLSQGEFKDHEAHGQDALWVDAEKGALVVSDGVSGLGAATRSELVSNQVVRCMQAVLGQDFNGYSPDAVVEALKQGVVVTVEELNYLKRTHPSILALSQLGRDQTLATLAAGKVFIADSGKPVFAWVESGDSILGKVSGRINPSSGSRVFMRLNKTRAPFGALGDGRIDPEYIYAGFIELEPGDIILAGSDGVTLESGDPISFDTDFSAEEDADLNRIGENLAFQYGKPANPRSLNRFADDVSVGLLRLNEVSRLSQRGVFMSILKHLRRAASVEEENLKQRKRELDMMAARQNRRDPGIISGADLDFLEEPKELPPLSARIDGPFRVRSSGRERSKLPGGRKFGQSKKGR